MPKIAPAPAWRSLLTPCDHDCYSRVPQPRRSVYSNDGSFDDDDDIGLLERKTTVTAGSRLTLASSRRRLIVARPIDDLSTTGSAFCEDDDGTSSRLNRICIHVNSIHIPDTSHLNHDPNYFAYNINSQQDKVNQNLDLNQAALHN
jgi:hypothetical protein